MMGRLTQTIAMIAVLAGVLMAQVPSDGLVAFYPFTGNWNDISGHGYNLTTIPQYTPAWAADRNGVASRAISLDGGSQGLHAPADSFPLGSSARTISVWVQLSDLSRVRTIVSWGDRRNGTDCSFLANQNTTGAYLIFTNSIDSLIYKTSSLYKIQSWTHLAVTLTATGLATMYMGDSILVSKQMTGWNTSAGLFGVGGWYMDQYSNSFLWSGRLDAVVIYRRALSTTEISMLANNTTDLLVSTKTLTPNSVRYTVVENRTSNVLYTINGRTLKNESVAGMLMGEKLKKSLRIQ